MNPCCCMMLLIFPASMAVIIGLPIRDALRYGWRVALIEFMVATLLGGFFIGAGVLQSSRPPLRSSSPQHLEALDQSFTESFTFAVGIGFAVVGTLIGRSIGMRTRRARALRRIRRCKKCGSSRVRPLTDIYCPDCGAPVEPAHRPGRCTKCDYDLTGNVSGRCPECGARIPSNTPAHIAQIDIIDAGVP